MRDRAASGDARSGVETFLYCPGLRSQHHEAGAGADRITCRILEGLKPVLESFKPDVVLVHGDTTTTMAASGGVLPADTGGPRRAGLRTGDLSSPWPEEGNRTLTGHLATYHFAPRKPRGRTCYGKILPTVASRSPGIRSLTPCSGCGIGCWVMKRYGRPCCSAILSSATVKDDSGYRPPAKALGSVLNRSAGAGRDSPYPP